MSGANPGATFRGGAPRVSRCALNPGYDYGTGGQAKTCVDGGPSGSTFGSIAEMCNTCS